MKTSSVHSFAPRLRARRSNPLIQLILGILLLCLGQAAPAQVTVLFEGFEGAFPEDNGWSVGDANATSGAAVFWEDVNSAYGGEGTQAGSWKGHCAGTKYPFASSEPNPLYDNDMVAFMQRSIDLTPYGCAQLEFWYKTPSIETCCDALRVFVGSTQVFNQSNTVAGWTQVILNLNRFVGAPRTLRFEFVSDLSVTAEGAYLDDIRVTGTTLEANNLFAAAASISGPSGTTVGNNFCATREAGEPITGSGRTVWYSWTSPTCCPMTFNTFGSDYDTVLCIYTGNAINALTPVGCNDDTGGGLQSRVDFTATEGTTYWIQVDSFAVIQGNIVLNWQPNVPAPANDSFATAAGLSGPSGSVNGHTCNATSEVGEPIDSRASGNTVWYAWNSGPLCCPVYFSTLGACFDTVMCVYTGPNLTTLTPVACSDDAQGKGLASRVNFTAERFTTYWIQVDGYNSLGGREGQFVLQYGPGGLPPGNDSFADATLVEGGTGSTSGHNCGATRQDREPLDPRGGGNTAWYRWIAPANGCMYFNTVGSCFDTVLCVYQGTVLSNLTAVANCNDDFPGKGVQSRVEFFARAGQTYWIQVDGYFGGMGNVVLNWDADVTPPLNDNFANAAFYNSATNRVLGNNCNATAEDAGGEPANAGRTVWWRWTAPSSGCTWFSTLGSGIDTLLCVYTGAALNALTQVGCVDDSAGKGVQSRLEFTATAGTVYWIRVDGFAGQVGNIVLRWGTGPGNDNLANATFLGRAGTITGNNRCATLEAGELNVAPGGGKTIWYGWQAPDSGCPRYAFSSRGSSFDTVVCVFHGAGGVGDLIFDACNDDFPGKGFASRVELDVIPGTTYYVRVDGFGSRTAEGDITLTWGPAGPPPANDNFAAATIIAGASGTEVGANCTATRENGEPTDFRGGGKTVWYGWTAPVTACVFFNTVGSSYDTVLCAYTGPAVTALTQVDCNDDFPGKGLGSRVEFRAVAGQKYWIQVDGFFGNHGNITLNWGPDTTPPSNDNFASAIFIGGNQGSIRGNNCNATFEGAAGEPGADVGGGLTVWYRWTAPKTTRYAFRTLGSSFDTVLCAFTGPSLNSLTALACVDDTQGKGLASRVEIDATAGTTYWIRVDGFAGNFGDILLSWGCWPRNFQIAQNPNHTATISWADPGYTLQSTPTLLSITNVWTDIPGSSPITVPSAGATRFFRLRCD